MTINELHVLMGHVNEKDCRKMIKEGMVLGIEFDHISKLDDCDICKIVKMKATPFPKSISQASLTRIGELVSLDLFGPISPAKGGELFFMVCIDHYSRYIHTYPLKKKSDAFEYYQEYAALFENKTGRKITCLRTDNGGEFKSNAFKAFLKNQGTMHHLTIPYTSQQNGVSERLIQTYRHDQVYIEDS